MFTYLTACHVINTSLVAIMAVNESDNKYEYFARCSDSQFWADKGRVKTLTELYLKHECLTELYRKHECLWNVFLPQYLTNS